jgi:hypothetical protein
MFDFIEQGYAQQQIQRYNGTENYEKLVNKVIKYETPKTQRIYISKYSFLEYVKLKTPSGKYILDVEDDIYGNTLLGFPLTIV